MKVISHCVNPESMNVEPNRLFVQASSPEAATFVDSTFKVLKCCVDVAQVGPHNNCFKHQLPSHTHQEQKRGLKLTAGSGCTSISEQMWDLDRPPFCSGLGVNGRKSVSAGRRDVQLTEHNFVPGWLPWFHRLEWNSGKMIFP